MPIAALKIMPRSDSGSCMNLLEMTWRSDRACRCPGRASEEGSGSQARDPRGASTSERSNPHTTGEILIRRPDRQLIPGNVYVVAAKRMLKERVSIDSEADPTEIAVLAD